MSKYAGNTVDNVLTRIRARGGIAHTEEFVLDILAKCQAVTNSYLKRVLTTGTLSLLPRKCIYDLSVEFTDCDEMVALKNQNKWLSRLVGGWRELGYLKRSWFRAVEAGGPYAFAQIGAKLLVVHPAPKSAMTLTAVYVKETPETLVRATALSLPDEDVAYIEDLAEIVLYARAKRIEDATAKVMEYQKRLAILAGMAQERK